MPHYDYDLFVIGGGSGGVRAARVSAALGKRVAIAEEYRFGGTCVIRGCVPKKLFVYASQFPEHFEDAAGYGWTVPRRDLRLADADRQQGPRDRPPGGHLPARRRKGRRRDLHRPGPCWSTRTRSASRAKNRTVTADQILIATGGRPNPHAALPGHEHCIFSNEAFDLPELPKAIVIAGGGYIAVEFANIFHGLGVETTLIYRGKEILGRFDMDLRRMLHETMERKGIRILCQTIFERIEKRADGRLDAHLTGGEVLIADQVMLAIGRIPNTENLGLEAAGVETGDQGRDHRRRLSRTNVEQHLGDRRRHRPRAADAGRDPRGDVLRRDRVQEQSGRARPRLRRDRGVLAARDRHGRPVRGRCGEALPAISKSTAPTSGRCATCLPAATRRC